MENLKKKFRGVFISKYIYQNKEVKWIEKILFNEIHSFTANNKDCYFSNEYLSNVLSVSPRQVSRGIRKLKEIGWISEVSFNGRKRFLKSNLKINYESGELEESNMSYQEDLQKQNYKSGECEESKMTTQHNSIEQSKQDKNDYHTNPNIKSINSSFINLKNRKTKVSIHERGKPIT